jgi:hypothetical protein
VITVAILINGQPIMARSAVNKGDLPNGKTLYAVDDGSTVEHLRANGAVPLAIALLKTIREPG